MGGELVPHRPVPNPLLSSAGRQEAGPGEEPSWLLSQGSV